VCEGGQVLLKQGLVKMIFQDLTPFLPPTQVSFAQNGTFLGFNDTRPLYPGAGKQLEISKNNLKN